MDAGEETESIYEGIQQNKELQRRDDENEEKKLRLTISIGTMKKLLKNIHQRNAKCQVDLNNFKKNRGTF